MQYEIKKIDLLTTAVFSGLFYGLIGLVPMIFSLVFMVVQIMSRGFEAEFFGFLFLPIGFFVGGFIGGLVFALVYNKVAEHWGGIKLEIDYKQDENKNR